MQHRLSTALGCALAITALACSSDGQDGTSCTVADTPAGARITCDDGSTAEVFDGMDGADGADGAQGPPGNDGAPGADGADGADGVGCTSSLISDGYEITCSNGTIYIDTTLGESSDLNGVEITPTEVILTASKKNGGAGGSRWFDALATLDPPQTLSLPASIPAEGNPGNGQKLYVLFDDGTDCAWFSGGGAYGSYRCFTGATRNGGTPSGFSGGTEVFPSEIVGASTVDMTVAGASGSGVITTATATFVIVP